MGKRKKKSSIEKEYEKYENVADTMEKRLADFINNNKYTIDKLVKVIMMANKQKKKNKKKGKIKFVIEMVPKGSPRPRINMFTKSIYVKGAKDNKEFFKNLVNNNKIDIGNVMITTPIKLDIKYFLPMPSAMTKDQKILAEQKIIRPPIKPDWDNLGKTTDMFTEVVWLDDMLIVDARVRKYFSFKPRVEVKIKYLLDYDCDFNRKRIENSKTYKRIFKNK